MALNIQRLNFDPVTGDNPSEGFMKLDLNIGEIVEAIDGDGTPENTGIEQRLSDAESKISNLQPISISGLYAGRPLAPSVPPWTIYYATDVLEAYLSNGTVWTVLPTSGGELGYAEKVSASSTSSTSPVDIAGLTVTCRVGEKPVIVEYGGAVRHQSTTGIFVIQMVYGDSVTQGSRIVGSGGYVYLERKTRISGLTPGSTQTFKLRMNAASAGTVDIYADANDRPFIRVANT
ncbi:hypothetical protein [Luteibacter yeojuensis]|uniref:Uncharacterized protein n=1 Tax=Luteibacter yeojuensis TaxID=345309 RepID=A0A7X5QS81_9GAMM|nr:hypothetical protein [Luteibacter yeojuensis]NID14409.1 hypothetical protein [Luteibacter yeojuensis]